MAGTASSPSKIDQFIAEFFVKCLHIILEARVPFLRSSSSVRDAASASSSTGSASSAFGVRSRDRWFNMVLGDCPAAREGVEPWRRNYEFGEPMVVDVLLVRSTGWLDHHSRGTSSPSPTGRRTAGTTPESWSSEEDAGSVVERWIVSFERFPEQESTSSRIDSGVYKRAIILIRSLYCFVRTLPAHRLFSLASSSSQSRSFSLSYRVSARPPPLTESEEASMMYRPLTPVDAQTGRLSVSVAYRHTTAVTALEVTPPILPRIITDYVGSPTTDPLRKLPSESLVGSVPSGGIAGRRGVHVVSLPSSVPSSPSSAHRRHSWGGGGTGLTKVPAALLPPSFRPSRSPSPSNEPSPPRFVNFPQSCPQTSGLQRMASQPIPIQEKRWSPPVPSSLSPSPPGTSHSLESSLTRYHRHSAPVNIPRPSSGLRGAHEAAHLNRNALPPPSPRRTTTTVEHHTSGLRSTSDTPTAPRLSISTLAESLLLISPPHPYHGHQHQQAGGGGGGGDDKPAADDGPPSGVKRSLYGSSRISMSRSRSSSKIHSEEVDDDIFACPFAVDDDEIDDMRTRPGSPGTTRNRSLEASGPRSKDAAVGALVRLLKSAPPLHERAASSSSESPSSECYVRSKSRPVPGLHKYANANAPPKSVGAAFEELRGYREMREFLSTTRQGGRKCTDKLLPSPSSTYVQ